MGKKTGKNYYAVRVGRIPGIYQSWPDCEQQVRGFSKAQFKGFTSLGEAQAYLQGGTALHSLHPSSRPQTKRRQTGGPAWQGALLQQYGLPQQAQLPHQHRTLAAASSSEELPGASGNEGSSYPDRMLCHPAHMYRLEFDGGARGNPGKAGAGAVLVNDATGEEVGQICEGLGHATNNVAEYTGLLRGLEAALACGAERIKCQGDSKLVVEQVNGRWQVKNAGLQPLHARVDFLKSRFKEFSIRHVYRDNNKDADALSNDAMDGNGWDGFLITAMGPEQGQIRKLEECPRCSRPMFEACDCDEQRQAQAQTTGMATVRQGNCLTVQRTMPEMQAQMPAQTPVGPSLMLASPYFQPCTSVG